VTTSVRNASKTVYTATLNVVLDVQVVITTIHLKIRARSVRLNFASIVRPRLYVLCVSRTTFLTNQRNSAKRILIRCKGDCLKCFDESDNCVICPVNKFKLDSQIV
jgi:hypothetical protein